jgi:hypothetical protein
MEQKLKAVAAEIMAYLKQHPMSADSLEGITYWWLVQQSIAQNVELVNLALQHLVSEGVVKMKTSENRGDIYYLKPDTEVPAPGDTQNEN